MDVGWFPTISQVKVWNHAIETIIKQLLFWGTQVEMYRRIQANRRCCLGLQIWPSRWRRWVSRRRWFVLVFWNLSYALGEIPILGKKHGWYDGFWSWMIFMLTFFVVLHTAGGVFQLQDVDGKVHPKWQWFCWGDISNSQRVLYEDPGNQYMEIAPSIIYCNQGGAWSKNMYLLYLFVDSIFFYTTGYTPLTAQ